MKYIVLSRMADYSGDEFTKEFDVKESALEEAEAAWDRLTHSEQKRWAVEVIESANPDEESENHFDGDTLVLYERRKFTLAVNHTNFTDMFFEVDTFTADSPKDAAEQFAAYLAEEDELVGACIQVYDVEEGERYNFLGEEL